MGNYPRCLISAHFIGKIPVKMTRKHANNWHLYVFSYKPQPTAYAVHQKSTKFRTSRPITYQKLTKSISNSLLLVFFPLKVGRVRTIGT